MVGLNGSGRSPASLSLETHRARARDGLIRSHGVASVSTPGAVDAWWMLHQRYGKLKWAELFAPDHRPGRGRDAGGADGGLLPRRSRSATSPAAGLAIEETDNFLKVWAPEGRTPAEGEIFANPGLARTLRLIAEGGRDGFYEGEVARDHRRATSSASAAGSPRPTWPRTAASG